MVRPFFFLCHNPFLFLSGSHYYSLSRYNISGKPATKLQKTSSHISSGRSLPNALIEEPKESNTKKEKIRKHYIYNNYSMKAIHLNEFLTCIRNNHFIKISITYIYANNNKLIKHRKKPKC